MADDEENGADAGDQAPDEGVPDEQRIGEITVGAVTHGKSYVYMLSGGKFLLAAIIITLAILIIRFPLMVFMDMLGALPSPLAGFIAAIALLVFVAFFILFSGWVVHAMWEWE